MNKQETFDKVAKHLIAQGKPALDKDSNCVYLDKNTNRKCAIGCLIPDHLYNEDIENIDIGQLCAQQDSLGEFLREFDGLLLDDLQMIHDNGTNKIEFIEGLSYLATQYNLKFDWKKYE